MCAHAGDQEETTYEQDTAAREPPDFAPRRPRSSGVWSAPLRPNMTGPVLGRANIAYELSARTKGTAHGGIGAIAKLIDDVGLAGEIDSSLELLKLHKPYHESDHVLEHRLQRPVRRATPAGHRGPPLRRGVPRRPGDREPAGPDHRRGLLPALRRSLDHRPAGGDQPRSAEGLAPPAGLVL